VAKIAYRVAGLTAGFGNETDLGADADQAHSPLRPAHSHPNIVDVKGRKDPMSVALT